VIVGAHYDHLGIGSDGKHFPGANDNASGVAGLLALAERLTESGIKPKRNIIFVAFGAEELGLLGSRYYATTRTDPLKTIAMFNMDMLGRGSPEELYVIGVLRNPELYEMVKKTNAQSGFTPLETSSLTGLTLKDNIEFAFNFGSDHYPFHQAKIPSLNFTSSRFPEEHTVNDTPDKINPEKIDRIIDLIYNSVLQIIGSDIRFPVPKDVDVPFPSMDKKHH
jgi:Zn-dependent M28 family amino/carboxypeptidase